MLYIRDNNEYVELQDDGDSSFLDVIISEKYATLKEIKNDYDIYECLHLYDIIITKKTNEIISLYGGGRE